MTMRTRAPGARFQDSKVLEYTLLNFLNNLQLVLGRYLLPSRRRCNYKFVKFGVFWHIFEVATLSKLATLKFSKMAYDINQSFLNNLQLVLGRCLLPSRRRCNYKFVKFGIRNSKKDPRGRKYFLRRIFFISGMDE